MTKRRTGPASETAIETLPGVAGNIVVRVGSHPAAATVVGVKPKRCRSDVRVAGVPCRMGCPRPATTGCAIDPGVDAGSTPATTVGSYPKSDCGVTNSRITTTVTACSNHNRVHAVASRATCGTHGCCRNNKPASTTTTSTAGISRPVPARPTTTADEQDFDYATPLSNREGAGGRKLVRRIVRVRIRGTACCDKIIKTTATTDGPTGPILDISTREEPFNSGHQSGTSSHVVVDSFQTYPGPGCGVGGSQPHLSPVCTSDQDSNGSKVSISSGRGGWKQSFTSS